MNSKFKTLWQLMRGNRSRYGLAIAAMALGTLVSYSVPIICMTTLDTALGGKTPESPQIAALVERLGGASWLRENLWAAAALILSLTAISAVCVFLKGYFSAQAAERIARNMRNALFARLPCLPLAFFDRQKTGDLVQRCTSDVETVRLFLSAQVIEMGHALMMVLGVLPIMLMLSPSMTLISLGALPLIVGFSIVFFMKVGSAFGAADAAEGKLSATLQENLTGIRVVRAFARQDFEKAKFDEKNADYRDKNRRMMTLLAWFWSSSDLICLTQTCTVMTMGCYWLSKGQLSVGTLYAFIAYVGMFLWPVRQMGRVLMESTKTLVALERIGEILDAPTEEESTAPATSALSQPARGEIVFEHVSFAYPTAEKDAKPVELLHDISFRLEPGQTLALLGPSGSGKSSIVRLLQRLYDATGGRITFDGHELNTLERAQLRRQFGVVLQEPFLFTKNLRDNIRIGRSSASETEVVDAAAMACIHESIQRFDKTYDTMLGERGVTLSGGQRQRVAIARALLLDAPVLILDDALSAVDTETETAILDALKKRRGKQTTILIAHRLSTLLHAEQILVLEHGKIVQRGTHATLSAQDGLYRKLWRIQAALEADLETELSKSGARQEVLAQDGK